MVFASFPKSNSKFDKRRMYFKIEKPHQQYKKGALDDKLKSKLIENKGKSVSRAKTLSQCKCNFN